MILHDIACAYVSIRDTGIHLGIAGKVSLRLQWLGKALRGWVEGNERRKVSKGSRSQI